LLLSTDCWILEHEEISAYRDQCLTDEFDRGVDGELAVVKRLQLLKRSSPDPPW
jgi:hypothetical protein